MSINIRKSLVITIILSFFTFNNMAYANNYYWVGNSGNWNNPAHWSNRSGGAGGIGIPSQNDNVFIDQNSFTQGGYITILKTANCNDFNWIASNTSSLKSSNETKLIVNGSFVVNSKFRNESYGQTIFSSSQSSEIIDTKGKAFLGDVIFDGNGGWNFINFATVKSNIIFNKGSLNLNNNHIVCESFVSKSTKKRILTSSNSLILVQEKWDFSSTKNLSINLSSSTIFVNNNNTKNIEKGSLSYKIITPNNKKAGALVVSDSSVTCNGFDDGIATAEIVGSPCTGFIFTWLAPIGQVDTTGSSDTIFNLAPGTYTVFAQDTCDKSFLGPLDIFITEPGAISILPAFTVMTSPTCFGDCNGSISLLVNGGTNPKVLSWGNGQTGAMASNLCADTISFHVEDANQCSLDSVFTLLPKPIVSFNIDSTNIDCFGGCNGTATVSNEAGGNGAPYSYAWTSTPPGQITLGEETTPSLTNLCSGNYNITVSDPQGCSMTDSVNITIPNQLLLDTVLQHVSCGGVCDGEITTTVLSGGTAPFTHNWSTGQVDVGNTSTVSGLCFGTYTDSIVDGNGCDTVITFTITEPVTLITSSTKTNVTCFGACDGTVKTNPSGGTAPYLFNWVSIPPGGVSTGQGTDSIADLCPAQYVVNITDNQGCTRADTVTITEPDLLVANPDSTNTSCASVCDGSVTAVPTGGTAPYTYSWTGPGGPYGVQSPNSLCAGTYIVTVSDSAGRCTAIDSTTVIEPSLLVLNMSSTDMSCNGVCDGTADVIVTGGTLPYNYNWVSVPGGLVGPGQGTGSITNLCAGTFTVNIIDGQGCTANNNVAVNEPAPVLANLTSTDVDCFGNCSGTATVTPAGGNPPYRVSWNGGLFSPIVGSETITGLCMGPQTAIVEDNNNCQTVVNFNISEPPVLTTNTVGTPLTCNSICSGTATTTPVGGTSPYSYLWSTGGTSNSVNSLCAGTYGVTITDDSSCVIIDSVTITEPINLDPNAQSTNVSCNSANDGTAIALPSGGTPPYISIIWTTIGGIPVLPAGNPVSGLSAGQYVVTVRDINGCTGRDTVTITEPLPLTVIANSTNASCGTICDGVITVTPSGGALSYLYQWDDPAMQTTQTANNLCAGIYTVTVTDTNGCIATDSDTVNNLVTIVINTGAVNNGCNTICDGLAVATPGGGALPYTFLWDDPGAQTTDTAFNLCQGWVRVTVTDNNGCASQDSTLVPAAPNVFQLQPSFTDVLCNSQCTGTASINPTGGIPPYSFIWSNGDTTNTTINNLCAGTYWVTGFDSVNCQITDTIVISEPDTISPSPTIVDADCNGNSTGSICLSPTGGTPGYAYLWGGGLGTASCINNQPAGTYTVAISDTNNCTRNEVYTISEPVLFSSNPISSDVTCFGFNDGMAGIILAGGTPPYSCTWNTGATTDTIFNLAPGPYSVICTDNNGCSTTQNFTINEPVILDANVTGTSIACGGTPCTGSALSNPTGGTPGYTFQWSTSAGPLATTDSIFNLCEDTFNVVVTDINGCVANGTYIVTTPNVLSVTLDSTNITCNNADDGTATSTPTGGTPPYTYSWVGGCLAAPDTNASISNLCAGTYTVTVTDSFGCFFIGSINIINPSLIDDNEIVTMANCGVCDGVITMAPSGGTPPYSHSWSNGDTTSTITGLCAGFYTDTITDFNGCIGTFTIAVSNPTGPSGVTTTVNEVSCYNGCDGALNVIPIGGTAPFTYTWSGPNGPHPNDSTLTGLCQGTYDLTLEDSLNCIFATSIVVNQNDSITENASSTNPSCSGICDGTASVAPSGGTAPYTFLWSDGSTGSSVSGLCSGLTSVTITDFNGCTKVVDFNITSPNLLSLSSTTTDALCNGGCDGTATVNPLGGTAPYNFQWNDPSSQTTQTATALCAGTYIVTVTDFNGCSANDTVTINDPSLITPNEVTTLASCGNNDGTATLTPTGGMPGYTYNWTTLGVTIPNPTGLAAGTYPVEITDNNGCMQTFLIVINNTSGPTVTTTSNNASCNAMCDGDASATVTSGAPTYSYLWSNGQTTSAVSGLCAGNYTVQVTDGNGCATITPIVISDNTSITATISTIDATCNGFCDGSALVVPAGGVPPYSYNWSTGHTINAVGGLCAGTHTVTISDAIGCSTIENVTIGESAILTLNVTGINANCNGGNDGSATVVPSGGATPYTFLWSNNLTTSTIVGLTAGTYSVVVTDANGCSANGNVIIGEGSVINTTISVTDATCGICDGDASASAPTGGAGGAYSYLWLPGGETTSSINNLCPGAYSLDVTDNVGCSQTFNILINNPNGPTITTQSDSVTCYGLCDGLAWTTVNAGNPPYIYQWDDPSLTTNDSANALCGGFYNVVVQDALGCISVDSVTVLEPQEILANISYTNPTCNGACDGTATVNPTGGIGALTFLWDNGQTTPTATGLCTGTHTVTITDGNGCPITDSITITEPNPINITISATVPTCNGDCDATTLATASGGTPGYTYSWNTAPAQTNSLATGLCAGSYIVTVTDNNSCSDTASVTIFNPLILSTSSAVTDASCNGVCDGEITTTPAGGVTPYSYIWSTSPIQTTQTATNLCAGTYYVTVIDANNCSVNDTLTVNEPAILNDSTVVTGPTCGVCDGSATSTPVGGVGPFDFTWTDPLGGNPSLPFTTLGQPSSTVVGLCAGTVDLQITDLGTGCTSNYTIIVNSATGPNITISSTNETCIGACDGTASASASGGFPPYLFAWSPTAPLITDSTATGLCSNFYTVTVLDSLGCVSSDTVTITTQGLNLSIAGIIPESCFGVCDGSATVINAAGTVPFTYSWSPTNPVQTTATATGLCVGLYMATVTDALSCSDSIGANITGPSLLSVSATINNPISCNGVCDGAAIATESGGTAPYTYSWNDPLSQTTQIATGLCAGTYIVTVTDNNLCTAFDTITITEPAVVIANEVLTLPACNVCDGIITLNPTGGVGPFTFLWTTPTSPPNPVTSSINNLCAGAYSVDITDVGTGCVTTFNFPLNNSNAPIPTTTVTNVSCNGACDGKITSNITGGTPPLSYLWNPSGQTTDSATALCAGTYTLTVTDNLGCVGVAVDSITEPNALQATMNFNNISCNGLSDGWVAANPTGGTAPYTYSWSPGSQTTDSITNLTAGKYIVNVTDSKNCSITDSVTLIEPTPIVSSIISQTDVSCTSNCDADATINVSGGAGTYTYQWNGNTLPGQLPSLSNMCYGQNTVLITDITGCSITDTINIGAIITVLADAGNDSTICEGTSIDLIGIPTGTITGVEWFELPSMSSLGTTDTILSVFPTGVGITCYMYEVTGGCVVTDTVCITTNAAPVADAGEDETIFEATNTTLNGSGGGTYVWTPGSNLNDSTIANPITTPKTTTQYVLMVTSATGCISYDTLLVTVLPKINFPDGITPNGDGKNDVWVIDFIEEFPNNVVEIYNRWGELLFHADGYLQNWDGTYNGKELPIGTYYYIIDLKSDLVKPFTGPITILR